MAEERVQRRLAAILAADVVGYSRLIRADESGTRTRYNAHLNELIEPSIAEHGGRTVKTMGDGFLVEFSSVVDAVQCSVHIQRAMPGRNAGEGASSSTSTLKKLRPSALWAIGKMLSTSNSTGSAARPVSAMRPRWLGATWTMSRSSTCSTTR